MGSNSNNIGLKWNIDIMEVYVDDIKIGTIDIL